MEPQNADVGDASPFDTKYRGQSDSSVDAFAIGSYKFFPEFFPDDEKFTKVQSATATLTLRDASHTLSDKRRPRLYFDPAPSCNPRGASNMRYVEIAFDDKLQEIVDRCREHFRIPTEQAMMERAIHALDAQRELDRVANRKRTGYLRVTRMTSQTLRVELVNEFDQQLHVMPSLRITQTAVTRYAIMTGLSEGEIWALFDRIQNRTRYSGAKSETVPVPGPLPPVAPPTQPVSFSPLPPGDAPAAVPPAAPIEAPAAPVAAPGTGTVVIPGVGPVAVPAVKRRRS